MNTLEQIGQEFEMNWYILWVFTGQEQSVKNYMEQEIERLNLSEYFGQILVPTDTIVEMREGKKRTKTKVIYPGYLFVEMRLTKEAKHLLSNVTGIMGFAGGAKDPSPMQEDEINRILGRVQERAGVVSYEVPFNVEEKVKINDGPFKEFIGTIKEINSERRKLKVLISIFGRSTPVEVDFLQVTTNISKTDA